MLPDRPKVFLLAALCLALIGPPAGGALAQDQPACAVSAGGGEWPSYGSDLQNTRSQPLEDVIDETNVGSLSPAWVFRVQQQPQGSGVVYSTPVIADGCVYFGTTSGWVYAVNAETGQRVWATKLGVAGSGLLCTGIVGSAAVADGRVHVNVSQPGSPYTAALDQQTGAVEWTGVMDQTPLVYNCASPVVFEGKVIAAFTGDQSGATNRGGFTIFDAGTGEELAKTYTIPQEDYEAGQKGGGVWSTPAIDETERYGYVGTSNPDAGTVEHPHTNAVVKFNLDPDRGPLGETVGVYKGNHDRYVDDVPHPPTCNPDPSGVLGNVFVRSILCLQMDLDFGASPQLFEGADGDLRMGNMQKSGVYHVARADTLEREWTAVVGPPFFYSNAATAATDGESIYVVGSPPGQMFSLDAAGGLPQWVAPTADAIHYQGTVYANGLVITNDAKGYLNVYRADNGLPLLMRPMAQDVGTSFYAEVSSGSAAVARNTFYVGLGQFLVAYRTV